MLADVWLSLGGQASTTIIVPKDAIVQRQQERLVVVLNSDNRVRIEAVQTGESIGIWIAVEGNVAPGERVIVRGNERLEAGQNVDATPLEYPLP
jgi:multidrug efflux pump subunit AcrA (membrane-fusion protein)